jgi:hypothetical protein
MSKQQKTTSDSNIATVLREATNGLLNEKSLQIIESAFNEEVEKRAVLREQAALELQDQEYSDKLVQVLEAIDRDKTRKLVKVVEAIDRNNALKLKKVIRKYNNALHGDARTFKESVVKHISDYLEVYLEELIPQQSINEAVKNKKAYSVLAGLRNQLSIGSSLLDESVRTAVIDGKQQIDALQERLDEKNKQIENLTEHYRVVAANLLLEQKSAGLPTKKKEYLKKVLGTRSPEFINENFEYTLKLYDKKENEQLQNLREEAMETRKVKVKSPSIDDLIINEQINRVPQARPQRAATDGYLEQLGKYI